MIIMFIFLGLTIVFIIGTAIYLNKSKKQNGFTQNIDKKENQGKKVDKKKLRANTRPNIRPKYMACFKASGFILKTFLFINRQRYSDFLK